MSRAMRSFGTAPILHKGNDQQPSLPQQTGETDIAEQTESVVQIGGGGSSYPLFFQAIQTAMEKVHGSAMDSGDIDGALNVLDTVTADSSDMPRHLQMLRLLDSGAVPWWAVISGSAVLLRLLLTTPLYVRQQRARSAAQRMATVAETWRHAFVQSAKLKGQGGSKKEIDREVRRKHHQLMLREGCHPVEIVLLPFVQAPVWMTMSCVLRHICGYAVWLFDSPGTHVEKVGGITWEGLAWFSDLSVPDTTLILPVTAALLHVANYTLAKRQNSVPGVVNDEQSARAKALRGMSFAGGYCSPWFLVYMGTYQPSGLVLYWVVSAAFSLSQTLLFGIPRVRQLFRLPPLPSQTKTKQD
ncbi:Cytochrome c oxidase assembly protein cox18, mitochondrial [Coemansia interrupta]|uniref:Cytochrome c oxidase assembly protein cox18, mitochondrial n=1 Tax=Coemansia interrupta TaxID=1126814 RepID=A0A9W8HH33_9FUNG|nr:Cytochrome c oxidase assembly protein cox18, mitochondrial [Coemansia interrupta]